MPKLSARTKTALLMFVFALPLLSGYIPRLLKHSHIFWNDFDTVVCAGRRALAGLDLYTSATSGVCAGLRPVDFIYMPIVAQASGWLGTVFGEGVYQLLYKTLYVASVALLLHTILFMKQIPGSPAARAPFLGLLTGSAVSWGNIAVVLHGAVAASARVALRAPYLFVLAAAIAGIVKPVFLLYLLAVLYAPWPIWKRLFWFALGIAAGLAPLALFVTTGGAQQESWRNTMEHFVLSVTPGDGFFGWVQVLGGSPKSGFVYAVYAALLALVAAAGLAIAESAKLAEKERIWLGVGLGALMFPRIMTEDVFLFAPAMLVVLAAAERHSAPVHLWARRLAYGGCIAALLLNLFDAGDYANKLAWAAFVAATLTVGGVYGRDRLRQTRPLAQTAETA